MESSQDSSSAESLHGNSGTSDPKPSLLETSTWIDASLHSFADRLSRLPPAISIALGWILLPFTFLSLLILGAFMVFFGLITSAWAVVRLHLTTGRQIPFDTSESDMSTPNAHGVLTSPHSLAMSDLEDGMLVVSLWCSDEDGQPTSNIFCQQKMAVLLESDSGAQYLVSNN